MMSVAQWDIFFRTGHTSLDRDRNWKQRTYAAARIPVYWIVNLNDRQIEQFNSPSGAGEQAAYNARRTLRPGEQISVSLDGTKVGHIAVDDLLP